ncbi:unnamed protein product [Ascophyllum nodosum]
MIRAGSLEAEVPAARRNVRMNVMDDGVRGMNASRLGLMLLTMVNIPLVAAGIIVLTLHWKDNNICEESHRMKWRWWALLSVVRLALLTPVVIVRWKLEGQREDQRNQAVDQLSSNIRNSLDIVGLVWFVIGHLWLLQNEHCSNPSESPIYQQLCLVYIIIMYIQICLPCILLMLLVPVICFCLPCVIRILGMLQGPQRTKGARKEEIEKLPTAVKYGEMDHTEDESCAICLVDYSQQDELRKLPCDHAFHKPCVDSWLLVNASCPNCRRRCFDTLDDEEDEGHGQENQGEEKTSEPVTMPMVGETLV